MEDSSNYDAASGLTKVFYNVVGKGQNLNPVISLGVG